MNDASVDSDRMLERPPYQRKRILQMLVVLVVISLTLSLSCVKALGPSQNSNIKSVEIYAFDQNPAGYDSGKEWVTLYNPSKNPVDIGGWKIKSTHGRTVTVEIPEGRILEPEGYWTYTHYSQWLDNSEESIRLFDENSNLIDQTPAKGDYKNDNQYWYNKEGWRFGVKKIESGIKSGKVINVVDGDTMDISPVGLAGVQRIRLACIDTPERDEEGYKEANNYVKSKCLGKTVKFDVDDVTQYGYYNRVLAVVYVNGKNLNKDLLDKGYAEVWEYFDPSKSEFKPYEWVNTTIFDTGEGKYPSISGVHKGKIVPSKTVLISQLYTYSCHGTGGHSEYVKIWNSTWSIEASWDGYGDDWHTISFPEKFILNSGKTYNYTIKTGSYPQIIHEKEFNAVGGKINCSNFTDVNGRSYDDWIPAIKLY